MRIPAVADRADWLERQHLHPLDNVGAEPFTQLALEGL
jgi:hypothetical protein